ncbi:MAG: transglycosylase SLT domain-containing protein [Proteobacteria bacterium]|nr:transglycosylase SLT domain-containing protein [Pseudomonadota bacterium]
MRRWPDIQENPELDSRTDVGGSMSSVRHLVNTSRFLRALAPMTALALLLGSSTPEPLVVADDGVEARSTSPATLPRGLFLRHVPVLPLHDESPSIDDIRGYLADADTERALLLAEQLVSEKKWGQDRNAAYFAIGMIERDNGRPNRASEAFTKVRAVTSPLAEMAAYFEAEQDLARGKPWVSFRECERYTEKYPSGDYVDACERVRAKSAVLSGRGKKGEDIAEAYDEEHPEAPISESIALLRAEAAFNAGRDKEAVRRFRELAVDYSAALTGRVAEERLAALSASGVDGAEIPDSLDARRQRALSLRDSGRIEEAWALYLELVADADGDARQQAWVDTALEVFSKRTRHYDLLIEHWEAEHAEHPTGERTADLMKVLGRAGRWQEAAVYAKLGREKYARTRGFSRREEDVGRTMMLGGDYEGAQEAFGALEKRGGWRGRRGRFLKAFAALMGGDAESAVSGFSTVIDKDAYRRTSGRYWRAAAYDKLGKTDEARADRDELIRTDRHSWYGTMTAASRDVQAPVWHRLSGRWWGPDPLEVQPPLGAPAPYTQRFTPGSPSWSPVVRGAEAFAMVSWPMRSEPAPAPSATLLLRSPTEPPPSYAESLFFSRYEAGRELGRLVKKHGEAFPAIETAYELARVGLYDHSGPLFSAFFEEYKDARRRRAHPRNAAARAISLKDDEWRQLFLYTRDHHHTSRYLHGLDEQVSDAGQKRVAKSLGYPLAHDQHVWEHGREHDVDPLMVMALMRAESTYNSIAVSRVGARGAMQIMPRTGHLLADIGHEDGFTAGDLEDPVLAVEYGITYLGLLQDRFDGVFPLSVAAYNGGPHNVSSWMRGTGADMPIDAFVEHIPFRETRRYVRRVSGYYSTYTDLYGPDGAVVAPPRTLRLDDKTVVDF